MTANVLKLKPRTAAELILPQSAAGKTTTLTAEPQLQYAAPFVPLPAVLCSSLHFSTGLGLSNRCVARTLTLVLSI